MKKRLLSMLMAVLMIASLVPATALAADVDQTHATHDVLTVNIAKDTAAKQPGIVFEYCNTCANDGDKSLEDGIVTVLKVTPFAAQKDICAADKHVAVTKTLQAETCDVPKITVTYCSVCGTAVAPTAAGTSALSITKDWEFGGHTYSQFYVTKAPTCTTVGYGYTVCDKCGEPVFVYGEDMVETLMTMNQKTAPRTSAVEANEKKFAATNPNHASNDTFVTTDVDVEDYKLERVIGNHDAYKIVKYTKYFAEVKATHADTVSGKLKPDTSATTAGSMVNVDLYDNDSYKWNNWLDPKVTGEGVEGTVYCKDCGYIDNEDTHGQSVDSLNESHAQYMTLKKGYIPYLDSQGNKINGVSDTWYCSKCEKTWGGNEIEYAAYWGDETSELSSNRIDRSTGLPTKYITANYYVDGDLFTVNKLAATCITKGYTGDVYKLVDGKWSINEKGKETPALGHAMTSIDSKEATCYAPGWTVSNYSICTRKDCTHTEGTSVVKAFEVGHNWKAVDVVAPTCKSTGITVIECTYCHDLAAADEHQSALSANTGRHYTVSDIAKTATYNNLVELVYVNYVKSVPHKAGELVNVKEATCTEKGYTGDAFCVWCNTQLVKGSETALKDHTPVNVEKVAATCTENGTEAGTKCSVCETVLSGCEVITAEGHKYVKQDDAVAATCTEAGKEASEKCSVCDDVIEGKVIDALGHEYENGVCTACGAKDPEYVAPEFKDAASIAEYAKEAVTWAANAQVVKGDDMGNFNPTANITRQDFVTMLWRLKGEAASNQALTFTDKANIAKYAATAVAWAVENGYIKGYEDGSFAPTANITRAEIVTILDRIAGNAKAEKEATFTDVVGHWAAAEIAWAAEKGVVNGVGDNKFAPDDNATRQDTVVMLYRFANLK